MVTITVEFPLGVYHAQSATAQTRAEWPPSPLRLIGALLAAAHGHSESDELEADRELIQALCEAAPPLILAPPLHQRSDPADERFAAFETRGPTRWVPRNYFKKGRQQAEASKVGVAIGELPIRFAWTEVDLRDEQRKRMGRLLQDVSFLGTSHSPAVAYLEDEGFGAEVEAWTPADGVDSVSARPVRVPNASTIGAFDQRHDARRGTKKRVEKAGLVPGISIGDETRYAFGPDLDLTGSTHAPDHWGDAIVLAIDQEGSEAVPKTAATYLFARAARRALLGAFGPEGAPDDAPPILRARGDQPHCAFAPLADVWHPNSSGNILGVALLLPSEARCEDVGTQRVRIERGLAELVGSGEGARRHVAVPAVGRVYLRLPDPADAYRRTLDWSRYLGPSRTWRTVTPMIHSRWRKRGVEGLYEQVEADCGFVGLPAPEEVEVLRGTGFPGGAARAVGGDRVPKDWRRLLGGPSSHLRIRFTAPVAGPVLLGRARHFGLGLMAPEPGRAA